MSLTQCIPVRQLTPEFPGYGRPAANDGPPREPTGARAVRIARAPTDRATPGWTVEKAG